MKSLKEFVILEEIQKETSSNEERRKSLEKWLKGKNYKDYVQTLNKMLKDPKAKTLLVDGFGSDLGDIDFKFSVRNIKASTLIPTQSEIDVEQSLKHPLSKPKNIANNFKNEIIIDEMPIVTFRENFIIDGHHRWAEVAMVNPDGYMVCFDYDAEVSPIQILKAVQGSIAAVIADDKDAKLPKDTVESKNLFSNDWDEKKILEYLSKNIKDECVTELMKHYPKCHNKDEVLKYFTDNILSMKVNNRPMIDAPKRTYMPQADKAGANRDSKETSKETSSPDDKGSALNKLKDGKFDKTVL